MVTTSLGKSRKERGKNLTQFQTLFVYRDLFYFSDFATLISKQKVSQGTL